MADPDVESPRNSGPESPSESSAQLIRKWLTQLSRTLRAFRLYASTHKLRDEMFGELVRRAQAMLSREEAVVLEIESDRLIWRGEPVFEVEGENSFVFRLFQDGARQIAFSRGLNREELNLFVDLVQRRPPGEVESYSVVNALWEADLPHMSHLAVDGFTDLLDADPTDPGESASLASRFQRVITSLVGRPETGDEQAVSSSLPPEAPDETVIRVSETIASPLLAFMSEPVHEADELRSWLAEARRGREEDLLLQLEDLLMHQLEVGDETLSDAELIALFTRITRRWLARGSFAVAGELLSRLEQLQFHLPERGPIAAAVRSETGGRALRELVTDDEQLEQAVWDVTEALQFFDRHLAVGNDELLELLDLPLHSNSRRLLAYMLAQRVRERPDFWAARFRSLRAGIAAVALASLAATSSSNAFTNVFQAALENPDPKVRVAAISCCPPPLPDEIRELLFKELSSPALEARCATIDRLAELGETRAGAFFVNRLRRTPLAELDAKEVHSLVSGILRLGPSRYTRFVRGQLEQLGLLKSGLATRDGRRADEQIRAVLQALARNRAPEPTALLREVRHRARGELREWCDELWRAVVADFRERGEELPFDASTPTTDPGLTAPEPAAPAALEPPIEIELDLELDLPDEIELELPDERPPTLEAGGLPPEAPDDLLPDEDDALGARIDEVES